MLQRHLNERSRVLEFGSGMSTLWYAAHAGEVYSAEDSAEWHAKISALLIKGRFQNVNYRLITQELEYIGFCAGDAEGFDLVMVDGKWRAQCMKNAIDLVRPGGILYLDNSDKHSTPAGGDTHDAEQIALQFAAERAAEVTYLTDFAPSQLFVEQGLCIRLPK